MTNRNQTPTSNNKHRRTINARFLWLISVIAGIVFFITFFRTPLFPLKWSLIVLVVLVVIFVLTFFMSVKTKPKNVFTKIVNIILCVVLLIGSILIPYEVDKISGLFNQVTNQRTVINVYSMSDEYVKTNGFTNVYKYDQDDNGLVTQLSSLKDAKFITSMTQDRDNSTYAMSELNKEFDGKVNEIDRESFVDAAEALYTNEGDFMIMPASYQSVLEDSSAYSNFANDTKIVYSFTRESQETGSTVKGDTTLTTKPFTIFLGGNDETGDLSLKGRTDVCMIVTVNPNTNQVALINMPRDSYVPNPYYGSGDSSYDKLTHLGLVGIDNTLKGLGSYLDEQINNYVILNFDTFESIIKVFGGITINNPYEFDAIDGHHFDEGQIYLNSAAALMYVRERENLPDGDFGRNMHQQIVMSAIIDIITSPEGILKFNTILDEIKGDFLTNLSTKAMYGLVNKQLNDGRSWNVVKYHVLGETGYEECASAPGEKLSVVYPYTNQVQYVKQVMDQVDAGDSLEQEELPDGKYNTSSK
jgi:cell envelope-related function transcriptional attenuator common domain